MFRMRLVIAAAVLICMVGPNGWAEQRFSVQLTGAYTELRDQVPLTSELTFQTLSNPFDPTNPFVDTAVTVDGEVPFDSEGASWEVTASYRFLPHVQVQLGYVDLGTFKSEKFLGPVILNPGLPIGSFNPFAPGSGFVTRPLDPQFPPLAPVRPFPVTGIAVRPATAHMNLDAQAVTLGLKGDYPVFGKARIYGRLGYLRAMFDASDTAGDVLNVQAPDDENGWYWGAGIQYPVWPRVLLGGGYAQYDTNLARFDSYQLSLEFVLF